jgi:hypothetical protein
MTYVIVKNSTAEILVDIRGVHSASLNFRKTPNFDTDSLPPNFPIQQLQLGITIT